MYGAMAIKSSVTAMPVPSGPTRTSQQAVGAGASSVSSVVYSAIDTQVGDLIVVAWGCMYAREFSGVTDTAGNTYTKALDLDDCQLWYTIATKASATNVVTGTVNGDIGTFDAALAAYRAPTGKAWTYQSAQAQAKAESVQSANPVVSPAITVSGKGLVVAWCTDIYGNVVQPTTSMSPPTIFETVNAAGGGAQTAILGDEFFTGGISGQTVSANLQGGSWSQKVLLVAPFTYA